jgi:HAD superfamily hydrolase (TIGR01509 family)
MAEDPNYTAVLFDFGGVLLRQDWDTYDEFGRDHGLPKNALRVALYGTDAWKRLQVGEGDREVWARAAITSLGEHCGDRASEVLDRWLDRPAEFHQKNIDLANALQAAGHRIGLLSNAAPDLAERLKGTYRLGIEWDDEVISGLVDLAKPDAAIFHLAAERIGLAAKSCFFIDDQPRNVEAARSVGMLAYNFVGSDYGGLQEALRAAGYRW